MTQSQQSSPSKAESKSQDEELLMRIGLLKQTSREAKDERPIMQQILCPTGGFDMAR